MWFARARQRFADWRTYRETVLILKRLDPHTLADVGLTRGPPRIGQHTQEVLSGAGLTEQQIAQLAAAGVLKLDGAAS